MLCPEVFWRKVAPTLSEVGGQTLDQGNDVKAPCIPRADEIRASLEEAIYVKPELEASKSRIAHLVSLQQDHLVGHLRYLASIQCQTLSCVRNYLKSTRYSDELI